MMKLQKLEIKSFRGATKPLIIEFDSQKPITMIFGENGNGKSSIADALICLCTDKIGSLEDKSSTDKKYLRALDSNPKDVSIELTTTAGAFKAKCNSTGTTFIKTPIAGMPELRQLRRKQITRLLDAEPSKRYAELQNYIDVANILKCEDSLRSLERTVETTLTRSRSVIAESKRMLNEIWQKENRPNDSWLKWAEVESSHDISVMKAKLEAFNNYIASWNRTSSTISTYRASAVALAQSKRELNAVQILLNDFLAENPNQDSSLLHLLNAAKSYINSKVDLENCPICSNNMERDNLLVALASRITAMNQLHKLNSELSQATKQYDDNVLLHNSSATNCYEAILVLCREQLSCVQTYFPANESLLSSFIVLQSREEQQGYLKQRITEFDTLFTNINLEQLTVNSIVSRHNSIVTQYNGLKTSEKVLENSENLFASIFSALEIVDEKRKTFVNDELASISGVVQTLYSKIHPNEPIGQIAMSLDPEFKLSIDILGRFHDLESITPQSLYSESHLDTLGLCIFLALAKKYREENTILVLDDVMMSVDHNHLQRFIDVLHEDLTEFTHIVLTTHYRPWRELYRHGRAPNAKIQFVELLPWSIEKGIRFQNGKVNLDELRYYLVDENFDRQKLCSLSGIVLENIFDFIAVKYQCKMPRKPKAEYVLSELINCIDNKLQKALKVQQVLVDSVGELLESEIVETELQPIIAKLKELKVVRNWVGAHFNPDASNISDPEVREFAETTLLLGDLITDPIEGGFPVKVDSGIYHSSKSGRTRMLPFAQPQ